jgi:dihydroxyacetone kinase-like predicted kinase
VSNPGSGLITGPQFLAVMRNFAQVLERRATEINDLNVFPVPDSDTGSNSALTVAAGLANLTDLEQAAQAGLGEVVAAIAGSCSHGALGNSGIILSEYLRGIGTVLDDQADVVQWARALKVGAETAREAVLTPQDGTMLTVAQAAAGVEADSNFENYLKQIQFQVRQKLIETEDMLPALKSAGVVDAGAVVITLLHDEIATQLANSQQPELVIIQSKCKELPANYSGPAFELMFEFQGSQDAKTELELALTQLGESISIAGDKSGFNFHIHTDNPDQVVELSRTLVSVGNTRVHRLIG